ncbi:MAG: BCCT family transporter [Bacteroidota bacterium]
MFSWCPFLFLIILGIVYFSPLAKVKIGGPEAKPILSRWRWFAIALCTTLATGVLLWGTAEPLYHLHQPPSNLGILANSPAAARFAMSTMFMHWSFSPYGIYTITALLFALSYYNYRQAFSIRSLFYPLFKKNIPEHLGTLMDIVCLSALVAGMAASLGTGIFAMMGGLEATLAVSKSDLILGCIGFAVVATFIVSAASGLQRGISFLSNLNAYAFFILVVLIFILGPTGYLLKIGGEGVVDYGIHFFERSTNFRGSLNADWMNSWTVFYFANWFAWAPVAALFLGRLSVGYSVRDFIHFNLILPSVFSCLWMMVFSGIALENDLASNGQLFQVVNAQGEENVMFVIFENLPFGKAISIFTLVMVFISYVTAADSNISAMSAISTNGISPEDPEAPIHLKVIWGTVVGLLAWVMITSAGIDGIRLLCVLGGFPALFIIIIVAAGLVRVLLNKDRSTS